MKVIFTNTMEIISNIVTILNKVENSLEDYEGLQKIWIATNTDTMEGIAYLDSDFPFSQIRDEILAINDDAIHVSTLEFSKEDLPFFYDYETTAVKAILTTYTVLNNYLK